MKYTIHGFSQNIALQLGMDNDDLLILRWIVDFSQSGKMNNVYKNNRMYYWIHYDSLLKDIPILRMKKDTLYRRLKKMAASEVLAHMTVKNKKGVYSYYGLGNKYYNLINNNDVDYQYNKEYETDQPCPENQETENNIGKEPSHVEGSDLNPMGVGNKSDRGRIKILNKDKSTNNSSTNNKNILSKKERKEEETKENTKGEVYQNEELQSVETKEPKKNTLIADTYNQGEKNTLKSTQKSLDNYSTFKPKNQETHENIIMEYTKSAELVDLLKEYLIVRYIQSNKKPLTNRQLKLLLTKLSKLTSNEDEKIEIVSNAVMGGFKTFYPINDKEPSKTNKNVSVGHTSANNNDKKIYDLTHDEYVSMMYGKLQRDQERRRSRIDIDYNWLEQ